MSNVSQKHIAVILAAIILLSFFCSCKKNKPTLPADTYINIAEEYLESDDVASALDILQKGFNETGDSRLAVMMAEIASNQSNDDSSESSESAFDNSYIGTWAEKNISYETGGLIVDISRDNEEVSFDVLFAQAAPHCRVAGFTIRTSNIHNDPIELFFEEDGWGNSGKITFQFMNNTILCSVADTYYPYDGFPMWGMFEGDYLLTKQDDAHKKMEEPPSETDNDFEYEGNSNGGTQQTTPTDPGNGESNYIELGGIRYDNIAAELPVSMDQVAADIYANEINKAHITSFGYVYLDLLNILPITGQYVDSDIFISKYRIELHGYFSYNDNIYECRFSMYYVLHNTAGWVYDSHYKNDLTLYSGTPFGVTGKKLQNFSYNDYFNACPLSFGEIADDLLYDNANTVSIDIKEEVLNIASLQIFKMTYGDNDILCLDVRVGFSNDTYEGTVEYRLHYLLYDAGGWELSSSPSLLSKKFTPINITYDETNFLNACNDVFDSYEKKSTEDSTDNKGRKVRTIIYEASRQHEYLTEYYEITITATFTGSAWSENFDIKMTNVDYSRLIGKWQYKNNDISIILTISDIAYSWRDSGTGRYSDSTAVITYAYEIYYTGATPVVSSTMTGNIDIHAAYFPYSKTPPVIYAHQVPIFTFSDRIPIGSSSHNVCIEICRNEGIYLDNLSNKYFDPGEYVFSKIS